MRQLCLFVLLILAVCVGSVFAADKYINDATGNDAIAAANGYAYTASTKTIAKAGAFAAYVYHAGDQLQVTVTGASSKADVGFYTIASRVGDDSVTLTTDCSASNEDDTNITLAFGNDGTAETTTVGALTGPRRTVGGGIAACADNDRVYIKASATYDSDVYILFNAAETITLEGYMTTPGDNGQATLSPTGASDTGMIRAVGATVANDKLAFKNLIIISNLTATKCIQNGAGTNTGVSFAFDNITWTGNATCGTFLSAETTGTMTTRSVTMTDCTITTGASGTALSITDAGTVSVTDSTISGAQGVYLAGDQGIVTITGNTFAGTTYCVTGNALATDTTGKWLIDDNVFTMTSTASSAIRCDVRVQDLEISNNTIEAAPDKMGIYCGADAATNVTPLGRVVVHDNVVTWAVEQTCGHGILIGSGCDGAEVYNNKALATTDGGSNISLGIGVKSEYCNIHHNVATGQRAIVIKGGNYNKVWNNTFIGGAMAAVYLSSDTHTSIGNVFYNNIIDGTDSTYAFQEETTVGRLRLTDYNCYIAGSGGLAHDGTAAKADLAAMRTWTGYDDNSIETASGITGGGDYSLTRTSACLGTGVPTPQSGKTSIGAWQWNYRVPSASDDNVLSGVTIDGVTGTVVLPSAATVKAGTLYGADGATAGTYRGSSGSGGWW